MDIVNYILGFIIIAGLIILILIILKFINMVERAYQERYEGQSETALSSFYQKMKAPFHSKSVYELINNVANLLIYAVIIYPIFNIIFMWLGLAPKADYIEFLVVDSLPNVIFAIIVLFSIKGFAIMFDIVYASTTELEGGS